MEHPGASEEAVVVEEVGVGQCDACRQPCVSSVLWSPRFAFQMTKRKRATAGASQLAKVLFVEDGVGPQAPRKLSGGTGGRGPRL